VARHVEIRFVPRVRSGRVIRHPGHDGAVLVNSIFPPTAGDHLEILSVASAALPLDAVENVLPILQMQDRALEFFEFFFDAHHACPVFDAFSNDRVGARFYADYATTGGAVTDRPRMQYPKIRRPHSSLD
jgi:hypothetical protein